MTSDQHIVAAKHAADAVGAVAILGAFLGYMPALAALGALVWYCVQVWESKTVQGWWRQRRQRRKSLERLKRATYSKRRKWEKDHDHFV